jgi:hypothetical protein
LILFPLNAADDSDVFLPNLRVKQPSGFEWHFQMVSSEFQWITDDNFNRGLNDGRTLSRQI